ncbi:glycosyltransferase family 4 protein [Ponticaulis profundi]|uniref:Glycosyltransferase family 4 protein n=1 Tax=Ponticaulis profundi TaxID=2665222 RepID=A0ABW1SEQ0_9PROT
MSLMTHHLCNALQCAGAEVTLVAPCAGDDLEKWPRHYQLISDVGFQGGIFEGREFREREAPRISSMFQTLGDETNYDRFLAFHIHGYGQVLSHLSLETKTPLSLVIHGSELKHHLTCRALWSFLQKQVSRELPSIEWETMRTLHRADEVLVNSPFTKSLVHKTGRSGESIHVIGCGLPENEISVPRKNSAESIRFELGIPTEALLIGSVGRLVLSKNFRSLVEILEEVPNGFLLLIGDGPERKNLKSLAESHGVIKRVRFVGQASESKKRELLNALDVFCLLSLPMKNGDVEGFGIAALEAMACNIPVIAAQTGGLPFALQYGESGQLIDPINKTELLDALKSVERGDDQIKKQVKHAQQTLHERFNWQIISRRLLKRWSLENLRVR